MHLDPGVQLPKTAIYCTWQNPTIAKRQILRNDSGGKGTRSGSKYTNRSQFCSESLNFSASDAPSEFQSETKSIEILHGFRRKTLAFAKGDDRVSQIQWKIGRTKCSRCL